MEKNEISDFLNVLLSIQDGINKYLNKPEVKNFLNRAHGFLQEIGEIAVRFYDYSQHQKDMYKTMSLLGWFPSYITFITPAEDNETPDEYMERCLTGKLGEIEDLLICRYPHREIIFKEAFLLFNESRYTAAIPLFLTQLDGLSAEMKYSPFFANRYKKDLDPGKSKTQIDLEISKFPIYLKEALKQKELGTGQEVIEYYEEVIVNSSNSFIGLNTRDLDLSNPLHILNRHGILHGHEDFLNYGDRINTLKIISLVLFVDHILSLLND